MNLGFSMGASPIQAQAASPALATQGTALRPEQVARAAVIAALLGAASSQVSAARVVIRPPTKNEADTFDNKRKQEIIRKLKTEKTEPSNDQRPQ